MKSFIIFASAVLILGCSKTVIAKVASVKGPQRSLVFENGKEITVEFAGTPTSRQKGLMHRQSLGKNSGMLFQFDQSDILSFWMKNTYIPLAIGFFDSEKKLINIKIMKPQSRGPIVTQDLTSYRSDTACLYALEVNPGWFKENKIHPGMSFKLLKP